nr:uncharacterized protein CI109_007521 [Kwoniella shandongensis]KAA5524178.1 hypothetical protein CI109_007521 [Kwoniella shandongensis]
MARSTRSKDYTESSLSPLSPEGSPVVAEKTPKTLKNKSANKKKVTSIESDIGSILPSIVNAGGTRTLRTSSKPDEVRQTSSDSSEVAAPSFKPVKQPPKASSSTAPRATRSSNRSKKLPNVDLSAETQDGSKLAATDSEVREVESDKGPVTPSPPPPASKSDKGEGRPLSKAGTEDLKDDEKGKEKEDMKPDVEGKGKYPERMEAALRAAYPDAYECERTVACGRCVDDDLPCLVSRKASTRKKKCLSCTHGQCTFSAHLPDEVIVGAKLKLSKNDQSRRGIQPSSANIGASSVIIASVTTLASVVAGSASAVTFEDGYAALQDLVEELQVTNKCLASCKRRFDRDELRRLSRTSVSVSPSKFSSYVDSPTRRGVDKPKRAKKDESSSDEESPSPPPETNKRRRI